MKIKRLLKERLQKLAGIVQEQNEVDSTSLVQSYYDQFMVTWGGGSFTCSYGGNDPVDLNDSFYGDWNGSSGVCEYSVTPEEIDNSPTCDNGGRNLVWKTCGPNEEGLWPNGGEPSDFQLSQTYDENDLSNSIQFGYCMQIQDENGNMVTPNSSHLGKTFTRGGCTQLSVLVAIGTGFTDSYNENYQANYNPFRLCPIQGVCSACGYTNCLDYLEGCTDSNADNYNPEATTDDGSCEYCVEFESLPYSEQLGNCNTYNNWESYENALTNDPYFSNYEGLENLYSNLISIVGPNGICCKNVPDPISGCMDEEALNYNPEANIDDNSCEYSRKYRCSACEGCIEDPDGPFDTLDECQEEGCFDGNLENYAISLGMALGTPGVDGTEMSAADQFCIKCQAQLEDPKCECCNTDYTYYDDYNILNYDPGSVGIPPKSPDKDPLKDKMQKLAGIKPEKK
jgi:hypothetical protein